MARVELKQIGQGFVQWKQFNYNLKKRKLFLTKMFSYSMLYMGGRNILTLMQRRWAQFGDMVAGLRFHKGYFASTEGYANALMWLKHQPTQVGKQYWLKEGQDVS